MLTSKVPLNNLHMILCTILTLYNKRFMMRAPSLLLNPSSKDITVQSSHMDRLDAVKHIQCLVFLMMTIYEVSYLIVLHKSLGS